MTNSATGEWYISACIPLKVIFNLCNDYNKVMWGLKQRIRMTRSNGSRALVRTGDAAGVVANNITDALTQVNNDAFINLTTLRWVLPIVRPSPSHELTLLLFEIVGNNSQFLDVAFLNKRTNSITNYVPAATTSIWPLATTSGV